MMIIIIIKTSDIFLERCVCSSFFYLSFKNRFKTGLNLVQNRFGTGFKNESKTCSSI